MGISKASLMLDRCSDCKLWDEVVGPAVRCQLGEVGEAMAHWGEDYLKGWELVEANSGFDEEGYIKEESSEYITAMEDYVTKQHEKHLVCDEDMFLLEGHVVDRVRTFGQGGGGVPMPLVCEGQAC